MDFNQRIKEISFILFGASITLLAAPLQEFTNFALLLFVSLALLLVGLGLYEWLCNIINKIKFHNNLYIKRVCVYAPHEIDSDTSSWVKISLRQLFLLFKKNQLNTTLRIKYLR